MRLEGWYGEKVKEERPSTKRSCCVCHVVGLENTKTNAQGLVHGLEPQAFRIKGEESKQK